MCVGFENLLRFTYCLYQIPIAPLACFFSIRFSNLKIERAEKRKNEENQNDAIVHEAKVTRRNCGSASNVDKNRCLFCNEYSGDLHEVTTFRLDSRVRQCALQLQDTVLLAKLSAGDLISQESVYHGKCLVALYNKASRGKPRNESSDADLLYRGIALAELITYIEDSREQSLKIFKLSDLVKLYRTRLEQLGVEVTTRIHSSDLKNRILANIPDLQATKAKQGKNIFLAFNEDFDYAVKHLHENNYDEEAIILSQAAKIVKREMAATNCSFDGTFKEGCQKMSVPGSLLSLISMILVGRNIKTNSENISDFQASLTIAQLLQFNCTFQRSSSNTRCPNAKYHSIDRVPPLPLYLGK